MSAGQFSFQTLRQPVAIAGVGLHTGYPVTARLLPRCDLGIVFARIDLPGEPEIPAALSNVVTTTHATTLAVGDVTVSTTEHLLAALWANGISHCRVELDGPEVPILDGSAAPWCRLLQEAGTTTVDGARPVLKLRAPVWVREGNGEVLAVPHSGLRITVAIDYDLGYIGGQTADFTLSADGFAREIAPARTFTLENWIEPLRAQGLIKGGSTENAIVLGEAAPSSPFRCPDELARHKLLDVIGDLALLGTADGSLLHAHIIAVRAGHGLHRLWMQTALDAEAFTTRQEMAVN